MPAKVTQWDIHANNVISLRAFYTNVFGWKCSHPQNADEYGWMFTQDGEMVGGIGQAGPEDTTGAAIFVQVEDVQSTMALAANIGGGTYWGPQSFPDGMVLGCISDPDGNGILLISPSRTGEPYVSRTTAAQGIWTWDIQSPHPDRLAPFYENLFGWKWNGLKNNHWGLMSTGPDGGPDGGITHTARKGIVIAMRVAEMEDTLAKVAKHGGEVLVAPHDVSDDLMIATCIDPEGNRIGLYRLTEAHQERDRVRVSD